MERESKKNTKLTSEQNRFMVSEPSIFSQTKQLKLPLKSYKVPAYTQSDLKLHSM